MAAFKKYLCVSTETSRLHRDEFVVDHVAWGDLARIENLCDYDCLLISLTALANVPQSKIFEESDIAMFFDPGSWVHVIASGGKIFILGDPETEILVVNTAEDERRKKLAEMTEAIAQRTESNVGRESPNSRRGQSSPRRVKPLTNLLAIGKDTRPLDYRRVNRNADYDFKTLYRYLDSVADWKYSIANCDLEGKLHSLIAGREIVKKCQRFALTSYATFLSASFVFIRQDRTVAGSICLLPSSGDGAESENLFVLREFCGIATHLPEPKWVQSLRVPGETAIEREIEAKRETLAGLQQQIIIDEARLKDCKRWYRLLYDDGNSLESIVKEGLELLGATVTKTSKVKDDYRVKYPSHVEGVMEVKGTHNPKFNIGALRQLAGWMDEANAQENIVVKGIFVGNGGRNDELITREKLFEKNNEDYALIKNIVIVRSMDLFCLAILKQLGLLDAATFWKEFYDCKGSFEATKYWELLPKEFRISKDVSQA